ncbi:MAG TPA: methyltransferase domain-containing protein [Candidatus Hydrogenedentes bacterium]|nr:methyltransferase domain-containing protein [Candidatus Hydrogenedentota bacterium]
MAKKLEPPSSPLPRTLGPVPDLERHLPSDWWRTLFTSVYLKTDGDVVENERNTAKEVDMIISTVGLEPNDRLLDLCCGQGRHCLELARRGFKHVTGIDRSRYLVRLARKRAADMGLRVAFHEGDARRFRLPESTYQCVTIMGNSFGYFDRVEDDLAVLGSVKRVLRSGGVLVLDIANGDWIRKNFDRRSWEWIDQDQFVCRERSLSSDGQRLISREVVVHAERGVIVDQFYAERLYSPGLLIQLLEKAGFEEIRLHGPVETESGRNQDLGMMAARIFVTARILKRPAAIKRGKVIFPKVTVLMGDPSLPDQVKRDGQFNEEDIETINRLKRALTELEDYSFEYVDQHGPLITRLKNELPQFVLNFCDEGFNNDAFKELHVPAYLEMLGIPYTGAGPACLGLCYNKALVRAIAASLDIPVPLETYFHPDDQSAMIPATFPALIKPNYGDSSIGITVESYVRDAQELLPSVRKLQEAFPGRPLLIQEFLDGAEYSIGIIGNPGLTYTFLPALEVDYSALQPGLPRILGYESKWLPDSPYWTQITYQEAQLDEDTLRKLQDYSSQLFVRLGCRDYARFDFRADAKGEIKLMEVNPNPGWCWDGKMNLMASFGGLRYADLLRMIIEAAQERFTAQKTGNGHGNGHGNGNGHKNGSKNGAKDP